MSTPPTAREIAELTARLRALYAAGAGADVAEREAFLADKHALLDRITAADREDADERDVDHGETAQDGQDRQLYHSGELNPATDVHGRTAGAADPAFLPSPPWLPDVEHTRDEPAQPDSPEELAARVAELRTRVDGTAATPLGLDAEQERREQLARWHTDDVRREALEIRAEVRDLHC